MEEELRLSRLRRAATLQQSSKRFLEGNWNEKPRLGHNLKNHASAFLLCVVWHRFIEGYGAGNLICADLEGVRVNELVSLNLDLLELAVLGPNCAAVGKINRFRLSCNMRVLPQHSSWVLWREHKNPHGNSISSSSALDYEFSEFKFLTHF
jgi:hypothetical protein